MRRDRVVDVIGRRRWFYTFSLLITIPGIIFILLTPLTGGQEGLKFSIDYTGGTEWQIKFADPNVGAADVKAILSDQGLSDSTVVTSGDGYFLIRTKSSIGLAVPLPSPTPSCRARSIVKGPRVLSGGDEE